MAVVLGFRYICATEKQAQQLREAAAVFHQSSQCLCWMVAVLATEDVLGHVACQRDGMEAWWFSLAPHMTNHLLWVHWSAGITPASRVMSTVRLWTFAAWLMVAPLSWHGLGHARSYNSPASEDFALAAHFVTMLILNMAWQKRYLDQTLGTHLAGVARLLR